MIGAGQPNPPGLWVWVQIGAFWPMSSKTSWSFLTCSGCSWAYFGAQTYRLTGMSQCRYGSRLLPPDPRVTHAYHYLCLAIFRWIYVFFLANTGMSHGWAPLAAFFFFSVGSLPGPRIQMLFLLHTYIYSSAWMYVHWLVNTNRTGHYFAAFLTPFTLFFWC